ncbi:MAG: sigma-54 dependent transcriptional regulator [Acidobacteriota bacterium]
MDSAASRGAPLIDTASPASRTVLIVDDQPAVRDALCLLFDLHGLPVRSVDTADKALAAAADPRIGVVVQDMNFAPGATEGDEGVDLFRRLRAARPELPVLLLTAWTSLETAVQLVKEGAADYLAKPWDDRKLLAAVRELLATPTGGGVTRLDGELCGMVMEDVATIEVVKLALQVAPSSVPVLITGPNGSGKEKMADIVHANSPRAAAPFLKVNVGALPPELLEAELFGAEAGAYTGRQGVRIGRFEAADGGTLFLDEIDSLPLAGQVKLLRVLESGEVTRLGANRARQVDVRVLTATNADLNWAIATGTFREDLFFRINVVELAVPPLSRRPRDLDVLAEHFLRVFAVDRGAAPRRLDDDARAALRHHAWPGNVRELRNRLQRADLLATGSTIRPVDLDLAEPTAPPAAGLPASHDRRRSLDPLRSGDHEKPALDAESESERREIEQVLIASGGIVAHAAKTLGLSRQALYRRMARLGIQLERRPGR